MNNIHNEFDYIRQQYYVFGFNRIQMLESAAKNMEQYNKLNRDDSQKCECIERFKDCIHDFFDGLEGERK